nr:MAG TPA: hypothetical protein [Caudoviricetes sp.]
MRKLSIILIGVLKRYITMKIVLRCLINYMKV